MKSMMQSSGEEVLSYRYLDSPIGRLLLAGHGETLCLIVMPKGKGAVQPAKTWRHDEQCLRRAVLQLTEYFAGKRRRFDLELAPTGTEFQKQVWSTLADIPYGETWSYGELAQRIGRPSAARAVGAANGQNPLSIVLPCHRVIGAGGSLVGYGGGLAAKQLLLELEGAWPTKQLRLVG